MDQTSLAHIIKDIASFINASKWVEDVHNERGNHVIIILMGNKSDYMRKRQMSVEEGGINRQKAFCL